mmetsp:Transcript_92103/g.246220  ORF Transcript_92103/g.246220 Transcript_92103/m.246220 type:complete len:219 (-) Transcript_92103:293-949(-)
MYRRSSGHPGKAVFRWLARAVRVDTRRAHGDRAGAAAQGGDAAGEGGAVSGVLAPVGIDEPENSAVDEAFCRGESSRVLEHVLPGLAPARAAGAVQAGPPGGDRGAGDPGPGEASVPEVAAGGGVPGAGGGVLVGAGAAPGGGGLGELEGDRYCWAKLAPARRHGGRAGGGQADEASARRLVPSVENPTTDASCGGASGPVQAAGADHIHVPAVVGCP